MTSTARCACVMLSLALMLGVTEVAEAACEGAVDTTSFAAGRQAYRAQDYPKAMMILAPLAEAGHPAAQYYVAHMYEKGDGVAQDASKTIEWYRRAAEQGYARAQYKLAIGYAGGLAGLEKDEAQARRWLLKAAQGGSHGAQRTLSGAYKRGKLGLPRDPEQARYWREQASKGK